MNKKYLSSLIVVSSMFASAASYAQCFGNVYSMNAGRGHVGALIDIKESASFSGSNYSQDAATRALIHSKALFSSSAMAYDKNTDRIYYASVPAPITYYMENAETFFTEEELKNLDFHAQRTTPSTLAYFDVATQKHVEVATTKFSIYRMAFHPETGELYASDARRLFKVAPDTGEVTEIGLFPFNTRAGGFTTWGDFEFYNNELLYVTSGRTFTVNLSNADLTLKAFHFVDFVTSVTTDQNGQLIMAAKNQNVTGNINSNQLWRLKPETGEKVQIGLFPTRISAMATVTSEQHACYEPTVFSSDELTGLDGLTVNNEPLFEGGLATLSFSLAEEANEDTTVNLSFAGSAEIAKDYQTAIKLASSNETVATIASDGSATFTIPAGTKDISLTIETVLDSRTEGNETLTVDAWVKSNKSDLQQGTVTITEVDPTLEISSITIDGSAPESGIFYGTRVTLNKAVSVDTPTFRFLAGAGETSTATEDVDFADHFGDFMFFDANNQLISKSVHFLLDGPNGQRGNPSVITLPAGTKSIVVGIGIFSDTVREGNETFNVIAALKHGFTDLQSAVVTIQDDD
ncbi:hypothetical protein G5S52_00145 [Grimontia sp. S25]|uniref:Uncharacterized protein n=1 Tax=Grimontia sedimenti TaxID=2711294 RepID=A0A6M1R6T3_9GAMM|nr:hypothetical protein [Grimontia sedimenti]NGN96114.1 hypothetical protein [Grimontia sedimenti]